MFRDEGSYSDPDKFSPILRSLISKPTLPVHLLNCLALALALSEFQFPHLYVIGIDSDHQSSSIP